MFKLPKAFKEIIPEFSQNNKWKELCFNNGGTPSTLQDIKVVPHSGGYAFSDLPNRFVYWRTNYDVLEIVELSLDFNLHNNQIRYKFQNAPILDGISIYERGNTVVILVPTVSSVHRLTFPHPSYERTNDFRSTSIFTEVSQDSISDPTTFHLFSTMPYLPHSAASVLADDDDNAMFSLALNNNSVLLIKVQRLTGMTASNYLKMESFGRKRFLSGLTEALLGNKSNEDNTVSLSLEKYDKEVFLFALSRNGQLRVWSCTKMVCVYEFDFTASNQALVGAQYYTLRKKANGSQLTVAIYSASMDYSQLLVLKPFLKKNTISFENEPLTYATPANVDLIEMTVDCDGSVILCIWRSKENGDTVVSALSVTSGKWSMFENYKREPGFYNYSSSAGLTSREFYLNLIFAPGAFSVMDIKKVLNIYKGTPQLDQPTTKAELRSKVCAALEMEIQAEALEYELSDDDYIDISERCWNKFYLNCIQYQETGRVPTGLFWLPSSSLLVVISKNNLSFFRTVDTLEEMILRPGYSDESQSFKHVMSTLSKISLAEEHCLQFDRALKSFHSLKKNSAEIAAEFKLQNKLNLELDSVMKYQDLQKTLRNLSDVLFMPETFEHTGEYGDSFRSELGVQLISCSISQIVKMRLTTCRNLVLLIQILDSSEIKRDFLTETLNLCHAYAILNWCCETVVPNNSQLISLMQLLLLNKPDIVVQPLVLDTIWSTLQYLWPLTNSINLAEYLLINKQHLLLTNYSRMVIHKPWRNMLVQNFIEMNEPYKALDLVKEMVDSPENYLKAIKMFECADQSDIVIHLAELAVEKATKINHPDLATLYSILFLHHLKLGRYDLAFVNMDKNPERSRRIDCLRELVITLMNSKHVEKLLNFPYNDLLPYLENIMEQRARSLQSHQAAPYYNFLYALHVRMENFRKAARVMFEQGFRSDNNKLQMLSYSVCLNCLSLVSPEHAWILKPRDNIKENSDDDGDVLEIYQLQDLTKEFELASARSKLLNCPPDVSAFEVVMKLISASRYRLALRISLLFELKLEPTFEALAAACTRITEDPDPWSWLVENDISDFIVGDENAVVVAWRLLEALLLKYEQPNLTTLHKAVASKIMSLNVILPYWLEMSYKKRNPGQLLRLYLSYGVLTEASKLCCEFIAAILGKGKENFEMNDGLSVNSSAKCLPTNAIDILLLELQNQQMNDLYEDVKNAIDIYLDTTARITNDKTRYNRDSGIINVRQVF